MFEQSTKTNGFKHVAELRIEGVTFYLGKAGWHLDLQRAELFTGGPAARDAAMLTVTKPEHRELIQARLVRRGLVLCDARGDACLCADDLLSQQGGATGIPSSSACDAASRL